MLGELVGPGRGTGICTFFPLTHLLHSQPARGAGDHRAGGSDPHGQRPPALAGRGECGRPAGSQGPQPPGGQGREREEGRVHSGRGLSSPDQEPQQPRTSLAGRGRGWPWQGLHQSRASGRAPCLQVGPGTWPFLPLPGRPHHFSWLPFCSVPRLLPREAAGPQPHIPPPSAPAHTVLGPCDCSYQLGSGEARLVSEDPIDDGEWHRVTALR